MKSYIIRDREAGNEIAKFETLEKARAELSKYEAEDKAEGIYTEDFYEIVTVEYSVCARTTEIKTRIGRDEVLTVEELEGKAEAVMNRAGNFSPDEEYKFDTFEETLEKFNKLKKENTSYYYTSNQILCVYQVYINKYICDEDGDGLEGEIVEMWTSDEIRRGA